MNALRAAAALEPLAPGRRISLRQGELHVQIAPDAGGRIAQIETDGIPWLVDHEPRQHGAAIAWGCYPMLPWAGRIRDGRFRVRKREIQLPLNLGAHAIHGVGFQLPWRRLAQSAQKLELALDLPEDQRWPFGGRAWQRIELAPKRLRLQLSVTAGAQAMPVTLGWHPWLRKPTRLAFTPEAMYPRDADGIATLPLAPPVPPPWDDCFLNTRPVLVEQSGRLLTLRSGCRHWVVYDQPAHATCVEPQTGPPDAFNLEPELLAAGATASAWFVWEWL